MIGGIDLVRHALAMGDPLRFESKWAYQQVESLATLSMPSTSLEPVLSSWAYWTRLDIINALTTGEPTAKNIMGSIGFHKEWAFFEMPGLREPPWDTEPREREPPWRGRLHASISTAILPSAWRRRPQIVRCCTLAWEAAWEVIMAVMGGHPFVHREVEPSILEPFLLRRLNQLLIVAKGQVQQVSGRPVFDWVYRIDTDGIIHPPIPPILTDSRGAVSREGD